jgi:hypothetical protein
MPCGLPQPSLYQSIWEAAGLPTGLNCPVTGGVFSPLCGGVSPVMDATTVQQCQGAQHQKYGNTISIMVNSRNAKAIQGVVKAEVLAAGLGCVVGAGAGSWAGPPGTFAGCGGGALATAASALPWAVVGNYVWQGFAAWGDIYTAEKQLSVDLSQCTNGQ